VLAPDVRDLRGHPTLGQEVGELKRCVGVGRDRLWRLVLALRWRLNDVTICSTSPILWTVERSIIASVCAAQRSHVMRCRSGVERGRGAFPQVVEGA
jgi:hypothetical protein